MSAKWVYRLVVLLVIVVVLNLPLRFSAGIRRFARDNFAPLQNAVAHASGSIRAFFQLVSDARSILEREQQLLEQITTLRTELARYRALEEENVHLRNLLGLSERRNLRLVAARIIGRGDITGWWQTIRLDKGELAGIRPNFPVINADGLIGKTIEVSRFTSDVLLVCDPNCRVPSRPARGGGGFGIVRGTGSAFPRKGELEMLVPFGSLQVDYLAKGREIMPGDEIVTSGLGGVYPEGIVVGRVVKVGADPSGLYRRAELVPSVDFQGMRYAFVVIPNSEEAVSEGNDAERKPRGIGGEG
ncbi:MAG: rod shape-determining protein MreC [Kiritimatiellae bacterium]|nr:rod shape-determining protein MreC [Kiritimatiellia bacterium]